MMTTCYGKLPESLDSTDGIVPKLMKEKYKLLLSKVFIKLVNIKNEERNDYVNLDCQLSSPFNAFPLAVTFFRMRHYALIVSTGLAPSKIPSCQACIPSWNHDQYYLRMTPRITRISFFFFF